MKQPFVGLEDVRLVRRLMQGELQAELVERHPGTGTLAVERERELGGFGEVEREVVRALRADAGVAREHAPRRLAKGDRDDVRAFGEALPGAEEEGDARPSPVV